MAAVTVIVDAENVRRSRWPNLSKDELLAACRAWAAAEGRELVVVFDHSAPEDAPDVVAAPSADDWIASHAAAHAPFSLVTSDRELRTRVDGAERVVGGGGFLELLELSAR